MYLADLAKPGAALNTQIQLLSDGPPNPFVGNINGTICG